MYHPSTVPYSTHHDIVIMIYTYQDAVKSDYEPSLYDINKEHQENGKNKQEQKLSGTFSTGKKKKHFCGTPHVHDKYPTVHSVQKSYRKDSKDNSTYKDKNLSKRQPLIIRLP